MKIAILQSFITVSCSVAEVLRYNSISPEVKEVPLRSSLMFPLHLHCLSFIYSFNYLFKYLFIYLHCPHEPSNSTRTSLICINLSSEEFLKKVNMVISIVGEISIAITKKQELCY